LAEQLDRAPPMRIGERGERTVDLGGAQSSRVLVVTPIFLSQSAGVIFSTV
jgi:hypothetical protein